MPRLPAAAPLTKLLHQSSRPIYVIDSERRIIYANSALASWLDLEPERIVGRLVEYHSVGSGERDTVHDATAPLADLCPPPRALAGQPCAGTISCVARDGRLAHRRAEFVPLDRPAGETIAPHSKRPLTAGGGGVFVLLDVADLLPQEIAKELSVDASADELHRTIRQFRRGQAALYRLESLLGQSSAMRKVRAQVAAAASSGSNVLVCGPPGSGRSHVARAIHYHASDELPSTLLPIDCELVNDDLLRRALETLDNRASESDGQPTLLLQNLERLSADRPSLLLAAIRRDSFSARIVATVGPPSRGAQGGSDEAQCGAQGNVPLGSRHLLADGTQSVPATFDPALLDAISTITIHIPRLADRLEDLPILAQCFLEDCNRDREKQIGSVRHDALDLLALYSWPGELDELREVIVAAHRACDSHEIMPSHLPAVIHHASQAASHVRRPPPQPVVLDALLAEIEKEVILRALAQAGGNKTEAAGLLGLTRPRLYRRLVQLGLAGEAASDAEPPGPEFVERDPTDQEP